MIKKIMLIALCIVMILFSNKVYALSVGWATVSSGGPSPSGGTVKPASERCPNYYQAYGGNSCPNGTPLTYTSSGIDYTCTYNYKINPSTNIEINSYDMTGKSLLSTTTYVDGTFPSGTWVGVQNKETRTATWSVGDYRYFSTTFDYTCRYVKSIPGSTSCSGGYGYVTEATFQPVVTINKCDRNCRNYDRAEYNESTLKCECQNYKCLRWTTTSGTTKSTTATYTNKGKNFTCPTSYGGYTHDGANPVLIKTHSQQVNNPPQSVINSCGSETRAAVKSQAENYVKNPTSIVRLITTDEYPAGGIKSSHTGTVKATSDGAKCTSGGGNCTGKSSGTWTNIFNYHPKAVCMNAKTSAITYKLEAGSCGADEIDVTYVDSSRQYWRYFIPTNTKSGSSFFISVEKASDSGSYLTTEECNSVVEKYSIENTYKEIIRPATGSYTNDRMTDLATVQRENGCYLKSTAKWLKASDCKYYIETQYPAEKMYTNYIKQKNGSPFKGDYYARYIKMSGTQGSEDKKAIEKDGCKFSTSINYSVVQEFYGEKTSGSTKKLEGYGMFFRQIDISKPFQSQSDLNASSYWGGKISNGANAEFNITKNSVTVKKGSQNVTTKLTAFDNITYTAVHVTKATVQSYKYKTLRPAYSSWVNMNANGTSDFIQHSGLFTTTSSGFYKLGCGPKNYNWSWCTS